MIYIAIGLLAVCMLFASRKSTYFWLFGATWLVLGIKWAWFDRSGWSGFVLPLIVSLIATVRGFRESGRERHRR